MDCKAKFLVTFRAKMTMSNFKHYPYKLRLIKNELDIHVSVYLSFFIFHSWFLCKSGINTFPVKKPTLSSTFLIRLRLYGFCVNGELLTLLGGSKKKLISLVRLGRIK